MPGAFHLGEHSGTIRVVRHSHRVRAGKHELSLRALGDMPSKAIEHARGILQPVPARNLYDQPSAWAGRRLQ